MRTAVEASGPSHSKKSQRPSIANDQLPATQPNRTQKDELERRAMNFTGRWRWSRSRERDERRGRRSPMPEREIMNHSRDRERGDGRRDK
ncbi:hypothetical protein B296_00000926 [Ensete ventricosum]|uniref:Uncharacterized protein n=1 Tax=Ensete ventricosum TaxID=4639 RepID=A0A427BAQ2_ENSVE|nr:hypothetical protein B296_00000926 [Ensete ventricosum]